MHELLRARFVNRLCGILCDVRASHAVCCIGTAPMKRDRRQNNHTPGGGDDGDARLFAKVADLVSALLIPNVLDESANPNCRIGHDIDGAIFFVDIIDCSPDGDIRSMKEAKITGVLMPGESDSLLSRFDDVLIVEEIRSLANRSLEDIGNQVTDELLTQI